MSQLGCFGLPSTYSDRSAACRACAHRAKCSESAKTVLRAVSGMVDITAFLEGVRVRYASTLQQPAQTSIMACPVKVRPRLARLIETGARERFQDAIGRGENPFPADRDKALHLAGDYLLRSGFTREQLRAELVALGWSNAAASSQVSNTLALLRGLLLVDEEDGVIRRSRHIQEIPL